MSLSVYRGTITASKSIFAAVVICIFSIGSAPQTFAQAACATTTVPATTYGQVKQSVSVAATGIFRIWSRIKASDATSNSYYLQIDSGCAYNVGDSATIPAGAWTWVNYQNGVTTSYIDVPLTAGAHQLTYTGREASVEIDRVLLLGDTTCIPAGLGDNCANVDAINPTVTIMSPANGATFTIGSTVNVSATAADNVGVTKVEFYIDGTLKSTSTSAPYTYAWPTTGVGLGAHALTARAYDAASNVAASTAISISVASAITISPTPTPIATGAGDANGDGRINTSDLSLIISHTGENYAPADFNHDGTVGAADLAILLSRWTW